MMAGAGELLARAAFFVGSERKKPGLLPGRDEPEIQVARCKQVVPDLFRIS